MSDETSPKPEVATPVEVKSEAKEETQNGNGSAALAVDKEEANAGNYKKTILIVKIRKLTINLFRNSSS